METQPGEDSVPFKKFLLFTAPNVASFESREDAVDIARRLKGESPMRWQVIDSVTADCVAEHRGEAMH